MNDNVQTTPNEDGTPEVRVRVPSVDFKTIKVAVTGFTTGVATALIAAKLLAGNNDDGTEVIVLETESDSSES